MEYLFTTILVFLSFFIGRIIAHYTKEEIGKGKKIFCILELSVLGAISLILLYGIFTHLSLLLSILAFGLGILVSWFKILRKPALFLGIGLAFSSFSLNFFSLMACLVFLYGLIYSRNLLSVKEYILIGLCFLLPSILAETTYFSLPSPFLAFSLGGILFYLYHEIAPQKKDHR